MDKILLEMSFYWLSDDIVRFKIEVGVKEKCTKCNTCNMQNGLTAAQRAVVMSWRQQPLASTPTLILNVQRQNTQ